MTQEELFDLIDEICASWPRIALFLLCAVLLGLALAR